MLVSFSLRFIFFSFLLKSSLASLVEDQKLQVLPVPGKDVLSKDVPTEKISLSLSPTFIHGFIATFCVIVISELGDKTFFIAAILSMRSPRKTVFAGAMSALGVMHCMSACFGLVFTFIPKSFTFYASSFLFLIFGIKMLREGHGMSSNIGQEEIEEVQESLRSKDVETGDAEDMQQGICSKWSSYFTRCISAVFLQSFVMTFLAEWGDRSQLATIVLAVKEDISAVIIAGLLGHACCTGLAVLGGRVIAQRISVRTVTIIGGIIFIGFAVTTVLMGPEAMQ